MTANLVSSPNFMVVAYVWSAPMFFIRLRDDELPMLTIEGPIKTQWENSNSDPAINAD